MQYLPPNLPYSAIIGAESIAHRSWFQVEFISDRSVNILVN